MQTLNPEGLGVPQDHVKAAALFKAAANQGHPGALGGLMQCSSIEQLIVRFVCLADDMFAMLGVRVQAGGSLRPNVCASALEAATGAPSAPGTCCAVLHRGEPSTGGSLAPSALLGTCCAAFCRWRRLDCSGFCRLRLGATEDGFVPQEGKWRSAPTAP